MDEIIQMATRLGKTIAASPQASQLRMARGGMHAREDVMGLLKDFQTQSAKIAQLQQENKPIEVDDKQKLETLHSELISKDVFKAFNNAQVQYVDLIRKVNEAITKELADVEG